MGSVPTRIGRYRELGYDVIELDRDVNCVRLILLNADQPEIIRKVGLNATGRIISDVRYRRVGEPAKDATEPQPEHHAYQGVPTLSIQLAGQAS